AVSLGETILGSILGRKSSTRATRATREISRTMKERRDKEQAEENLKALQQEREKLEAQFQSEINAMESKINPLTETFESVLYAPKKTNIQVQLVALVWVPSSMV
ncbi:MAG: ATP-binding protein, partial [Thermoproteota archaeon]